MGDRRKTRPRKRRAGTKQTQKTERKETDERQQSRADEPRKQTSKQPVKFLKSHLAIFIGPNAHLVPPIFW